MFGKLSKNDWTRDIGRVEFEYLISEEENILKKVGLNPGPLALQAAVLSLDDGSLGY